MMTRPHATHHNPLVASGAEVRWIGSGGLRLRVAHWSVPEDRATQGTVVIIHGYCEFMEKYIETVQELLGRGLAVRMLDLPGHGLSNRFLSDPTPIHMRDMGTLVAAVEDVIEGVAPALVAIDRSGPLFLLAHSLGGHVALRYLHDHPGQIDRAVLLAPMFGLPLRPWLKPFAPLVARLAVGLGFGARYAPGEGPATVLDIPFEQTKVTRNRERYSLIQDKVRENPALGQGGATWGWVEAVLRSMGKVDAPGYAETIKVPVLMVLPGDEHLVDPQASQALAQRLPKCEILEFPAARHEILQEEDGVYDAFWKRFDPFMGLA